ncbi:MAG TPA: hypothetical protein VKD24_00225 [Candidatus Angelobacter sp.]|nr:hypothetical protein [Candidatus Angelobacter sp.]
MAFILFLAAAPATAAPVIVQGITFSDERGDFTILEVTGAGSLTDPFVVVEDVTGSEPVLVIRFPNEGFGNRVGTRDPMGMTIIKLAINHSGTTWYGYRIEPRTMLTLSSPDSDGLSLGQGWSARPSMASNDFRHVRVIDQPYDALDFDDGRVEEGQTAVFKLVLTASIWQSEIFVLQTPEVGIACVWPQQTTVC